MYRAPGFDQFRWMELEIEKAQKTLDGLIDEARRLPDTEPSKAKRITRLNAMKREASTAFNGLNKQVQYWSRDTIPTMYRTGWLVGATQLQAGMDFTLPHKEALDIISKDAYTDVATNLQQVVDDFDLTASKQILYEGMDPGQILAIQDKTRGAVTQALLTGEADPRKVASGLADELWEDGVKIVDGGGNRWNMDTYTRMLVRTKSANAYNAGSLGKYAEEGVNRVTVFDGTVDDEACAEANGQTWTLKFASEHPIEHPNCRRAFAPKPGGGDVNRGDDEAEAAAAASGAKAGERSVSKGLFVAQLVRAFAADDTLSINGIFAHLSTQGVEQLTGIPSVFLDDLIGDFVSQNLRQLEELVSDSIDPTIFTANLVEKLPAALDLIKSKNPQEVITTFVRSVKQAGRATWAEGIHPLVSDAVDAVSDHGMKALRDAGLVTKLNKFVPHVTRSELLRALVVMMKPAEDTNQYGRLLSRVMQQWSQRNDKTLIQAFKDAKFATGHMVTVKRATRRLVWATAQEALLVRNDLDNRIRLVRQLLFENVFDEVNAEIGRALQAVDRLPLRAYDDASRAARQLELEDMLEELQRLRSVAEAKVVEKVAIAAHNFGGTQAPVEALARRLEVDLQRNGTIDLDQFRLSRTGGIPTGTAPGPTQATGGRKLLAPVRGSAPATSAPDMASPEEIAEVVEYLAEHLPEIRSTPFAQDQWNEFTEFFADVLRRYADDPDDPVALDLFRYIDRKSVATDYNVHLLGGEVPLPLYNTYPASKAQFLGLLVEHMSNFSVVNGEMRYAGELITPKSPQFIAMRETLLGLRPDFFYATSAWHARITEGLDPTLLLKFVNESESAGAGVAGVLGKFRRLISDAGSDKASYDALVGGARPNHRTLGVALKRLYGEQNVSALGNSGANGTVWKVTDQNGVTFVVKSNIKSNSGEPEYALLSYAVSDWVDEFFFGGRASITTKSTRLDGEEQYLAIMPYFDGDVWNDVQWADDIPGVGVRRMRLFDMIGQEVDGHGDNYMFSVNTNVPYSIDNEMTGMVFNVIDGRSMPVNALGIKGTNFPAIASDLHATDAWLVGNDVPKFANGVPVRLVELTEDEAEALFEVIGQGRFTTAIDASTLLERTPVPVVITQSSTSRNGVRMFVPAGRVSVVTHVSPVSLGEELITENLFLSRVEAKKLRQIIELEDDAVYSSSPIVADLKNRVREVVETMTDTTRAKVIEQNLILKTLADVTDDEIVDQLTGSTIDGMIVRAKMLLRTGVANDGAVTQTTGINGVTARVGHTIEAVRPDGTPVSGLVVGVFRDDFGELVVQYSPNIGTGKTAAELKGQIGKLNIEPLDELFTDVDTAGLVDLFGAGDNISTRTDISAVISQRAPQILDDPPLGNPRFATVPRTDEFGIQIGETVEHITYHAPDRLDDGIRVVGEDGRNRFVSWADIYESDVLHEIIDEELARIPAEYRPREIVLHFDQLVTSDGKPAFGFVEADTRTMHLSFSAMLTDAKTAQIEGTGDLAYDVFGEVSIAVRKERLIRAIAGKTGVDNFRELVRHELGHVIEVGLEERERARIVTAVWRNLIDEYGALPATRAELNDLIHYDSLIPDGFDIDLFDDLTDAFIASRVELIEDMLNTNRAVLLDEVFNTTLLRGEDVPVWMSRAYEGIQRHEPDAYHEFFAEIWTKILAEPDGGERALQLVAQDMGVDPELLRRIIFRPIPDMPESYIWDAADDAFQAWLRSNLDDRAIDLIPRARSANRRLWKVGDVPFRVTAEDLAAEIALDIQVHGYDDYGATIHMVTGKVPDGDVIAVARHFNEQKIEDVSPEQLVRTIKKYINKASNREFLETDKWHLGIWVDSKGQMTLDVSMVFDDPIDAAIFGFKEQQEAGFRFKDFEVEHYLDEYKDFNEWFAARGEAVLAERGIKLTDELYDSITQRVGAAFADLQPQRRGEVRNKQGKLLPIGMEALPVDGQAKMLNAGEHKYVVGERVPGRKNLKPTEERVVITPHSVKANLETVLERAEIEYGLIDRSLPNDEWIAARNIHVQGVDVSDADIDAFIDELRDVYDQLDQLGIKPPGSVDLPGKFHNNAVVFTIESGTKMRKFGFSQIGGKVAPNGASTLGYTHINKAWRDLPGSLSRSRRETIIHEIAHHYDRDGNLGRALRRLGFDPKDISPYAAYDDSEFFAEAFLAVVTGRAPEDLVEAMIGFSFDGKEVFTSTGLVEMDRGAALRILHRFYTDWHAKYKQLSLEHDVPMWKIVGVGAILSPGMHAETNRDAAAFMIDMLRLNPAIRGRDVTKFKAFLRESAEGIRVASLKDNGGISEQTQKAIDALLDMASRVKGAALSDMSDEQAAYAVAWLAQTSGIMVSDTRTLSLTGAYGMPQVIRAMKVLTGTFTLDDGLGNTKTRSFYNNIMDPKDLYGSGDVTIDFHMANAAAMVLGMQKIKHAEPTSYGMEAGLRPIIGDIVRELFDEGWGDRVHSDSPGELQEVIWAIWRASTDWERDKKWFGELPLVTTDPNFKPPSAQELEALIRRLGLR